MIRIRYNDFAAGTHDLTGLHGRAERGTHGVTVYLVPGLTAGERKAVFRRLRQESSRGIGAPLPRPQLAAALALDRVRTAAATAVALVRLHPAVTLLPGACVAAGTAFFVVAAAGGPELPAAPPPGLAAATSATSALTLSVSALSVPALSVAALPGPASPRPAGRAAADPVPVWKTVAHRAAARGSASVPLTRMTGLADIAGFTAAAVGGPRTP